LGSYVVLKGIPSDVMGPTVTVPCGLAGGAAGRAPGVDELVFVVVVVVVDGPDAFKSR
jgi:hypothetical protein